MIGKLGKEVKALKKILIVEDDQLLNRTLAYNLTSDGYEVISVFNFDSAVRKLRENEFDVALLDINLPDGSGLDLCEEIRNRGQHTYIIFITAKDTENDTVTGFNIGADDYISKPFSIAVLTSKIQNMMRTRRHMLEKYAKSLEVEPEKITFNAMDEELLKRAVSIVEENIDNFEFSTDEFAQKMNMSRSNLHLKLKAITGESAIDFIRKVRFKRATELLKSGRYTVTEVSSMVGFNSSSYFATCFKKYIGCLPTEYIKKVKG